VIHFCHTGELKKTEFVRFVLGHEFELSTQTQASLKMSHQLKTKTQD